MLTVILVLMTEGEKLEGLLHSERTGQDLGVSRLALGRALFSFTTLLSPPT